MEVLYRNYIPMVYDELRELYTIEEWKKKRIILFGMNPPTEIEYDFFEENDIKVDAIVDNNKKKHGSIYKKCTVMFPSEALADIDGQTIIIIASGAHNAMEKQIVELGGKPENIYNLKNFFYDPTTIERFPLPDEYDAIEYDLKDVQQECLKILKVVDKFCNERDIKYFLSDGTLLGAVRHKGFIPWDDDVDIAMPWNDYVRFCKEFHSTDEYEINTMMRDDAYDIKCNSAITRIMCKNVITERPYFPIYSRQGICIDVFPLNGYPDTQEERDAYENELRVLAYDWKKLRHSMGLPTYSKEEHKKTWEKMLKLMQKYDYNKSTYVGGVSPSYFNYSIAPKKMYGESKKMQFEDSMFSVPSNPEYILTQAYGDYNVLPPENKRYQIHFLHTCKLVKKDD